jgi:hypothetical protein
MGHFAKVENGIVTQVIVADQDFIDTGAVGDPGTWVQTSYNTQGGKHRNGGTPLRKNYAGIGYVYDADRDAFYAPQPFASWVMDNDTCYWHPPVQQPEGVMPTTESEGTYYEWDESIVNWKAVTIPKLETQA